MPYDEPNYTQTPNVFFDSQMKHMGESELKVTLTIIRKTFGWHKREDRISLSQLEEITGLSRQGVIDGIQAGLARGTIGRVPDGRSFKYHLVVNDVDQSGKIVNDFDYQSVNDVDRKIVNDVDTQKKVLKKDKETIAGKPAPPSHPEDATDQSKPLVLGPLIGEHKGHSLYEIARIIGVHCYPYDDWEAIPSSTQGKIRRHAKMLYEDLPADITGAEVIKVITEWQRAKPNLTIRSPSVILTAIQEARQKDSGDDDIEALLSQRKSGNVWTQL